MNEAMSGEVGYSRLASLRRSRWLRFAFRRTLVFLASLWVLVTVTFLAVHLVPGDPARAGLSPSAPKSQVEARRASLKLDEPFLTQYVNYAGGAITGNFGTSFTSNLPVSEVISERFPKTLQLALLAFLTTLIIGIPLGVGTAVLTRHGRHRWLAGSFTFSTGGLISVPDYLLGTGLIALFGVTLGWLPVAGAEGADSYLLPVAALAAAPTAFLARTARIETLKVLDQEYMRLARSKRLRPRTLYLRHALPNALTATLTVSGLLFGGLIAGTVIVENVFAWPGLGSSVTEAIVQKDYPLVQGIVFLLGGIVLLANLVVDILLGIIDPRSTITEL